MNIKLGDIVVKDIIYEDLPKIHSLLNESDDTKSLLGKKESLQFDEVKERFLESLSSVSDFFLGIYKENNIIGIIKGRFENKSNTELWILTYLLGESYREKGIGTDTLKEVEKWFDENYSVHRFCVFAYEDRNRAINFWNKNGYQFLRKTKIKHPINSGAVVILEKRGEGYGL
ncbi:MAG: GNAT family N-acetyltransferase [Clostridium sp.]|uniref:GNAT family N-acetyltransferase n=1 Tax=Clostridium sp. TaxID=1506 RepID=UPI002FC5FABA